jgi:hypothetical protein
MKYSKIAGAVRWSGGTTLLRKGQSADDDHPLVLERPRLFTAVAPGASLSTGRKAAPVVERATRAPGERRRVGRPRKAMPAPVEDAAQEPDADE